MGLAQLGHIGWCLRGAKREFFVDLVVATVGGEELEVSRGETLTHDAGGRVVGRGGREAGEDRGFVGGCGARRADVEIGGGDGVTVGGDAQPLGRNGGGHDHGRVAAGGNIQRAEFFPLAVTARIDFEREGDGGIGLVGEVDGAVCVAADQKRLARNARFHRVVEPHAAEADPRSP